MKVQVKLGAEHPAALYFRRLGIPVRDRAPEIRRLLAIAVAAIADGGALAKASALPPPVAAPTADTGADQAATPPPSTEPRRRKPSVVAAVELLK